MSVMAAHQRETDAQRHARAPKIGIARGSLKGIRA